MTSYLNSPFPCDYGDKEKVYTAFLVGLFVAFFLALFQPFGIVEDGCEKVPYAKFAGFGIVTFLGMLFVDYVLPKLMTSFFEERSYTLGRELLVCAIVITVIGIGNALYLEFFFTFELGIQGMLVMIWQTFLVGIFPLTILTLLKFNKLQKSNMKVSEDLNSLPSLVKYQELKVPPLPSQVFNSEKNIDKIDLNGFLYAESVGNYINVTTNRDDNLNRRLYRRTLKSAVVEIEDKRIIQCHRSYLVNLEYVTHVEGNAQGLKLSLLDCEEKIPVSRKYIKVIKDYFAQF